MAGRHTERAAVWSWAQGMTDQEASLHQDIRHSSRSYPEEMEAQGVRAGEGRRLPYFPRPCAPHMSDASLAACYLWGSWLRVKCTRLAPPRSGIEWEPLARKVLNSHQEKYMGHIVWLWFLHTIPSYSWQLISPINETPFISLYLESLN